MTSLLKKRGTDICGIRSTFVVRSDLRHYIRVDNIEDKTNGPIIQSLSEYCSGGDHYFALPCYSETYYNIMTLIGTSFWILKGNNIRIVRDLTTDAGARNGILHEKCRGGDFYMALTTSSPAIYCTFLQYPPRNMFIVIRAKTFEVYEDLERGIPSRPYQDMYNERKSGPYDLHKNCTGGIYYWTTTTCTRNEDWFRKLTSYQNYFCIVKHIDEFGAIVVHRTFNLHTDEGGEDITLHLAVANFLSCIPMNQKWDCLKSFKAGETQFNWHIEKVRKVGYNQEVLRSVEHRWSKELKCQIEPSFIEKMLSHSLKIQFSASACYIEHVVDTSKNNTSTENTDTFELRGELNPGEEVYIWQYAILTTPDNKTLLHTPHFTTTNSKTPPQYNPMPPDSQLEQQHAVN